MRNLFGIGLIAIAMLAVLCSCQTHYTKSFRLSTEDPAKVSGLTNLVDGPLGEFQHSQLFLRVVALYESNNKDKMKQNAFNVLLEQRLPKGGTDTIKVDSLIFTMWPSGEKRVMGRQKILHFDGNYSPEPRFRSTFGTLMVPPEIDTMLLDFTARGGTPEEAKVYTLTLIRFEGETSKFGIRPKDEL